ncbi:MAG: MotA/TolQ/ExbB proton channel family protein, partial [Paludibacter sp.]
MVLSLILQAQPIIDTVSSAVNSIPVVSKPANVSLWDIIQKGGVIMIPIGILLVTAIYIFIERYITIRDASAS